MGTRSNKKRKPINKKKSRILSFPKEEPLNKTMIMIKIKEWNARVSDQFIQAQIIIK